MSVPSSKISLAFRDATLRQNNIRHPLKSESPSNLSLHSFKVKKQGLNCSNHTNNSLLSGVPPTQNSNIKKQLYENSSKLTSGPSTCVKAGKQSQYRYSGSPDHEDDDEEDFQDDHLYQQDQPISQENIDESMQDPNIIEESSEQSPYDDDYRREGQNSFDESDEEEEEPQLEQNTDHSLLEQVLNSQNQMPSDQPRDQKRSFAYHPKQESNQQFFGGANQDEEQFLFDSLNSMAPNETNCQILKDNNDEVKSSQLHITLKQAIANFAQEKQMQQKIENLRQRTEEISDKDNEIRELRIQMKEQEIRLHHADSMLAREKQEKESNAISFKRILSQLTGNNKENTPLMQSKVARGCSQKNSSSRKLSQQFETHSSINCSQNQFKFLIPDGSQLNASRTLENDSIKNENDTLHTINQLQYQLTSKQEELKLLKKQQRRTGNQSVWWANKRAPGSTQHYYQSSQNYSPLPTQPSMPSCNNLFLDKQISGQKPSVFSPVQGSPILSHQGSINSWGNQQVNNKQMVPKPNVLRKKARPSLTEVAQEYSFENQDGMLERKNYNNKRDSNTGQKSKIKSYRSLEEEDKEEMADLAAECGDQEKNLEMVISGGDYSPNSHTFFKQPFDQQKGLQHARKGSDHHIISIQKCPKDETRIPQSAQTSARKKEDASVSQKGQPFFGSILQSKNKKPCIYPQSQSLSLANKVPVSKQNSSRQSPIASKQQHNFNQHNLSGNYNSTGFANNTNAQAELVEGNQATLGPHNSVGTTTTSMTNTTTMSNISPLKQPKRVIPDSLVKLSKFSLGQQRANSDKLQQQKPIKVSNYSVIQRKETTNQPTQSK